MASFWTFVAVAASVAAALPWDGASPTDPVVAGESLGWTPIPTQPPLSPYGGEMVPMPGKHIFARAFKDQLCGYINSDSERAWTCDYSLATCTTGSSNGVLGCCYPDSTGTGCGFRTACIGAAEQSSCGVSCLSNTLMRKCTDSTAPFCIMYTDTAASLSVWGCTTSSGLTEAIVVNAAITMEKETTIQVVSRTSFIAPSVTGNEDAFTSGANLPLPTVTSKKSNVGAIAGGVVGGLAVVVLGGLGLFLVLSRRKKKAAAAVQGQTVHQPGAPPVQPMMQQPPMQPMHSGGYPDQSWNNQAYASAAQPQMMPQQQSQENKYTESDVTTPVNGPPQYGAQPQQQYYPPQQQGYYAQQPQQPQPTELPDRQ